MDMRDVKPTPDRLAFMRYLGARGLSVYAVHKGAGVGKSTLSNWLRGSSDSLTVKTERAILEYLDATREEVFTTTNSPAKVPLVGRVAAGEHVVMFDASDIRYVDFPPGLKPGRQYECLEVDGYSMPPALPGWLVFYSVEPVDVEKVLNQPCVVRLDDGRLLFKVVRRFGAETDRWSLHSWSPTVPPIEPVKIIEARPFKALTPPA